MNDKSSNNLVDPKNQSSSDASSCEARKDLKAIGFEKKVSNEINFSRNKLNKRKDKIKSDILIYESELNYINTAKKRNSIIENQFNQKTIAIEEILRLLRSILKCTVKTFYASFKSVNRSKLINRTLSLEKELIAVKTQYLKRIKDQKRLCEEARLHSELESCVMCSGVTSEQYCKL